MPVDDERFVNKPQTELGDPNFREAMRAGKATASKS